MSRYREQGRFSQLTNQEESQFELLLNLDKKEFKAHQQGVKDFLNQEIRSIRDIQNHAAIATKFGLSIASKKVISAKKNLLKYGDINEFKEWLIALCDCGFSSEHLEENRQEILSRILDLSYETTNVKDIISLLVHAKNLGIFNQDLSEDEKYYLADILNYVIERINKSDALLHNLTVASYQSLADLSLYFNHVLNIETDDLHEIVGKRDFPKEEPTISDIQREIFEQINSLNLPVELEVEYGEIARGIYAHSADIVINFEDYAIVIEVDGPKHFNIIDGQKIASGSTEARNKLLAALYGKENVIVIGQDQFHHFTNKDSAQAFLKTLGILDRVRKDSEQSVDSGLGKKSSDDSHSDEEKSVSPAKKSTSKSAPSKRKKKKPAKPEHHLRSRPEDSFDFDDVKLPKHPGVHLKNLVDQKNCNLEEVESFIRQNHQAVTGNSFDNKTLLEYLVSKEEIDLELFIMVLGNFLEKPIDKRKLLKLAIEANRPVIGKILDNFIPSKKSKAEIAEKTNEKFNFNQEFEQSFSWTRGNQERLRKFILFDDDYSGYDLGRVFINGSRWELAFLFAKESFFDELCKNRAGYFIVSHACFEGDFNLLQFAVERGFADKEKLKTNQQYCARLAFYAVRNRDLRSLKYLREQKFFISDKKAFHVNDLRNRTLLFEAIERGDLDTIKYLVEELKYDVNHRDEIGITPFLLACKGDDVEILKYLQGKGANINYVEPSQGYGALDFAAEFGSVEIVAYLHDKLGFKIDDEKINNRKTPILCLAVLDDKIDKVKYFVEHGARLNKDKRNDDFNDPVHFAAHNARRETVYYLHQKGAVLDRQISGSNCLNGAIIDGDIELARFFCENGVDVNSRNATGLSCLDIAVRRGHLELAKYLVSRGAIADASTLGQAVVGNNQECLEFIHKHFQLSLDQVSEDGSSPFILAVTDNFFFNTFRYLVENNANIDYLKTAEVDNEIGAPTQSQKINYSFYFLKNLKTIAEFEYVLTNERLKALYDFNDPEQCQIILFFAVASNDFELVKFVHEKLKPVAIFSHEAFCKACELGNYEIAKYLATAEGVSLKQTLSTKSRSGIYPAHLALKSNNTKIVKNSKDVEQESSIALIKRLYSWWQKEVPACYHDLSVDGSNFVHFAAQSGNVNNMEFAINKAVQLKKNAQEDLRAKENSLGIKPMRYVVCNFPGEEFRDICINMPPDATTLLYAIEFNQFGVVKILEELVDERNFPMLLNHPLNDDKETSFMRTCLKGDTRMVRFLHEKGGDIHAKSIHRESAIFFAVRGGLAASVRYILDKDPRMIDEKYTKQGATRSYNVFEDALLNGSGEIVNFLMKNYSEKFLHYKNQAIDAIKITIARSQLEERVELDKEHLNLIFEALLAKISDIFEDRPQEIAAIFGDVAENSCFSDAVRYDIDFARRIFLYKNGVCQNLNKLSEFARTHIEEVLMEILGDDHQKFSEKIHGISDEFSALYPDNLEVNLLNKFLTTYAKGMKDKYPQDLPEEFDFRFLDFSKKEDIRRIENFINRVVEIKEPEIPASQARRPSSEGRLHQDNNLEQYA